MIQLASDKLLLARINENKKWLAADLARDEAAGRLDVLAQKTDKNAEKPTSKLSRRDEEKWQDQLSGVEMSMFRQTINHAARYHVSNCGYVPLIRGAIDGLLTLVDTKGVEASFPNFQDPDKVGEFRQTLLSLRKELDDPSETFNSFDVSNLIKRIETTNHKTVELPEPVLTYEMTEGALDVLDQFSAVIWPRELESFKRNFQGNFCGVGIQIALRNSSDKTNEKTSDKNKADDQAEKDEDQNNDEDLVVVSPLEDSPALTAGVKAGDRIVSVDGKDTSGWSLDEAVRQITGLEGTPVTLGIARAAQGKHKAEKLGFKLNRAKIPIESIRGWQHRAAGGWDYYVDAQYKIGYIRLSQFIPQSADDLDAAINQMEKEGGCDALIIDLRFDPGGLLIAAVDVANRFIPSGVIVSTDRVRRGKSLPGRTFALSRSHAPGDSGEPGLGERIGNSFWRLAGLPARHDHRHAQLRQGFGAGRHAG